MGIEIGMGVSLAVNATLGFLLHRAVKKNKAIKPKERFQDLALDLERYGVGYLELVRIDPNHIFLKGK